MCNVNINLTLQFFFPNFFIIYKILTSPFLGYSSRSALYLRDVHQRDSSACVVSLMSVNKKQSVMSVNIHPLIIWDTSYTGKFGLLRRQSLDRQ